MNKTKLYGFYSKQAAEIVGTIIYTRPDGTTVEVTCVDKSPQGESYKWPDKESRGEVVKSNSMG